MSAPAAANSPPAKGKCREAARGLVPKLRFPEFSRDSGWDCATVADLVDIVAPPKKLPSSTYLPDGRFPIIDQSRSYICGWTNNNEAVITTPLPVVVFGDHTCVLKFVDHPFAQGADGIKIVTANRCVSTPYLYHQLSHRPLVAKQYKRHFSTLKNRLVYFPDPKLGEQRKIADCLGSLDDLIAAEGRKLEALRQHKKGLMQQLFPQPGETAPRLRFPEFRETGDWRRNHIGSVASIAKGKGLSKADIESGGAIPCIRYAEIYTHYGEVIHEVVSSTNAPKKNLMLSQAEDVIVPASGETKTDIAKAACVLAEGVALGSDLNVLRSDLYGPFFSYLLNSPLRHQIARIAQGDTVAHLYPKQISQVELAYPSHLEQQKIAECLGSLDALIAAGGRKLEALRQHKRGLMQQLFPNPKEGHA
ncbi:MAG: restriction endonuclease subunit S [Gammaproteobacteria bacterium]|nr:restriction endonuclease subunit S [Gammaproteobacteria bacterium]